MIDWSRVFASSLWLTGSALLLAVAGYSAYANIGQRRSLQALWRSVAANGWARLGGLLFCGGMALTSGSELEGALWGLLGLYLLFGLWSVRRRQAGQALPAPPMHGASTRTRTARPLLPPSVRAAARWLVKTELLWLALVSPAFLFPSRAYAWALLALPLLWLARRVAHGRFLPPTPFDWTLVVMALMAAVSLYATFDIGFSLGKVTGLLFAFGVFYAVVEWASGGDRLKLALGGYVLAGVALAVVGLLGADWVNKLPVLRQFVDLIPVTIRGLPGAERGIHPNELGGALLWVAPLQLALFGWSLQSGLRVALAQWLIRLGLLSATALCAGTLLLTQSRSALSGFLVGALLLTFLALQRARLLLAALLLVGAGVIAYIGPQRIADELRDVYGQGFSTTDGMRSIGGRAEIWSRALYGIEDFSFTGMGMNAFRRVMPILYPTGPPNSSDSPDADSDIGHAHNHLLQAALDLGLAGLVAYMALWMLAAALLVGAWRGSTDSLHRAAVAGIGGGLLASFVYGLTDTVALGAKPGVFFWALLGLLVAVWQGSRRHTEPIPITQDVGIERDVEAGVEAGVEAEQPKLQTI